MATRNWLKRRALSVGLIVGLVGSLVPGMTLADSRCSGGPGMQVWENSNYSGGTWIVCAVTGNFSDADLTNNTSGLGFFANWNDRISSYQTFNTPAGVVTCFWKNFSYSGTWQRVAGNHNMAYVGNSMNDTISSFWRRASSPACG